MADNVCRNCKWATWQMTNHQPPRIHENKGGKCEYPLDRVAIPYAAVTGVPLYKSAIWRDSEMQCRVWEKK